MDGKINISNKTNVLGKVIAIAVLSLIAPAYILMNNLTVNAQEAEQSLETACSAYEAADFLIKQTQPLTSDTSVNAKIMHNLASPVLAGVYNIDALSYDAQHPSEAPSQAKEQWHINLYNSSGTIVYASYPTHTEDIPDTSLSVVTRLASGLTLDEEVVAVEYVHYGWPEIGSPQGEFSYNSVIPACLAFTQVIEGVQTILSPACTINLSFIDGSTSQVSGLFSSTGIKSYNQVVIDWGDDSVPDVLVGLEANHSYSKAGSYTVMATVYKDKDILAVCASELEVTIPLLTIVEGATDNPSGEQSEAAEVTAVLAATGISPIMTTAIGLGILSLGAATALVRRR